VRPLQYPKEVSNEPPFLRGQRSSMQGRRPGSPPFGSSTVAGQRRSLTGLRWTCITPAFRPERNHHTASLLCGGVPSDTGHSPFRTAIRRGASNLQIWSTSSRCVSGSSQTQRRTVPRSWTTRTSTAPELLSLDDHHYRTLPMQRPQPDALMLRLNWPARPIDPGERRQREDAGVANPVVRGPASTPGG
jgi:hypothetical protein